MHALGNVVSVDVEGGPPPERAARGAEHAPARRGVGRLGRARAAGVQRALLGAVAQLPLPDLQPAPPVAVRAPPQLVGAAAARRGAATGRRRAARSASTTSARSRRRRRATRSSSARSSGPNGSGAATTSTSRSPPTASSATWCERSSGRCSSRARTRSRRSSTAGRATEAGKTAPPWGLYLVARHVLTERSIGIRVPPTRKCTPVSVRRQGGEPVKNTTVEGGARARAARGGAGVLGLTASSGRPHRAGRAGGVYERGRARSGRASARRQRRRQRNARPARRHRGVPGRLDRRCRSPCGAGAARDEPNTRDNEHLTAAKGIVEAKDPVIQKKRGEGLLSAPLASFDWHLPAVRAAVRRGARAVAACRPIQRGRRRDAVRADGQLRLRRVFEDRSRAAPRDADQGALVGVGGECAAHNDGDPVVVYDQYAGRWLLSVVRRPAGGGRVVRGVRRLLATSDATGAYNLYFFDFGPDTFLDYPHFGVWRGRLLHVRQRVPDRPGDLVGRAAIVYERDKMLAGQPARFVWFDEAAANPVGGQYIGQLPADADGSSLPPQVSRTCSRRSTTRRASRR